jgi:hypothetical protein
MSTCYPARYPAAIFGKCVETNFKVSYWDYWRSRHDQHHGRNQSLALSQQHNGTHCPVKPFNEIVSGQKQTNRRPADELADLRQQIAQLRAHEAELREGFVSGRLDRQGDDFDVEVVDRINERIDLKRMRASVDASIWAPFLVSSSSTYVTLRKNRSQHEHRPKTNNSLRE